MDARETAVALDGFDKRPVVPGDVFAEEPWREIARVSQRLGVFQ
jgi:hypothetical protein